MVRGFRFSLRTEHRQMHRQSSLPSTALRGLLLLGVLMPFLFRVELTQTLAWVSMIYTYQQEDTFHNAIRDTFNGERPCNLCEILTRENFEDTDGDHAQLNRRPQEPPTLFPAVTQQVPGRSPASSAAFPTEPPQTGQKPSSRLFRPPRMLA